MSARPLLLALFLAAAPLAAGCLATEPETPAAAADSLPDAAAEPAPLAFSNEGGFGLHATACPLVVCIERSVVGSNQRLWETDVRGDLAAIDLTMEWDASSPLMEELVLGVFTCAAPCETDADITSIEAVQGGSPLALQVEGFSVAEDETVHVFVSPQGRTPMFYTTLTTPQSFLIEGWFVPAGVALEGSSDEGDVLTVEPEA